MVNRALIALSLLSLGCGAEATAPPTAEDSGADVAAADAGADATPETAAPVDVTPPDAGAVDAAVEDIPPPPDVPAAGTGCTSNDACATEIAASPCAVPRCDFATGACVADPLPDGTTCPASSLCVTAATCVAGACQDGAVKACDDGDACTTGSCDAATGACVQVHIVGCGCVASCAGKACGDDGCGGTCGECDDGIPCTYDACAVGGAACNHVPNSGACAPGGPCVGEVCDATTGCQPRPCTDDGNACTADACAGEVCQHLDQCDDGDACTADTCDPLVGCAHGPLCADDGSPCLEVTCQAGQCAVKNLCDDGVECTADACAGDGCTHVDMCDDGDACTDDACADDGQCQHTPSTCPPSGECTVGVCLAGIGCTVAPDATCYGCVGKATGVYEPLGAMGESPILGAPNKGFGNAGSTDASDAFDGYDDTAWLSTFNFAQDTVKGVAAIGYDFTVPTHVARVSLLQGGSGNGAAVSSAIVQSSDDGESWSDVQVLDGIGTLDWVNVTLSLPSVPRRYWRLLANAETVCFLNLCAPWRVRELVFESDELACVAPSCGDPAAANGSPGGSSSGADATSAGMASGPPAIEGELSAVFDADFGTSALLAAGTAAVPAALAIQLVEPARVTQVSLRQGDADGCQAATSLAVQRSEDGVMWTTLVKPTSLWTSTASDNELAVPVAEPARHWRVLQIGAPSTCPDVQGGWRVHRLRFWTDGCFYCPESASSCAYGVDE